MRLLTWNILAEPYAPAEYAGKWDKRLKNICDAIRGKNADIICLQEVELCIADDIYSHFLAEYDMVRHKVSKHRTNIIGNMTMWKKSVSLVYEHVTSTSVITGLCHEDKIFGVANVHLKAGDTSDNEDIRISQVHGILKKLNTVNTLMVGDYNSQLMQRLGKVITDAEFVELETGHYTFFTGFKWVQFDHIMVRGDVYGTIKSRLCDVINTSSDHIMVYCDFCIRY